jgi:acetylornithine deacetylase
MTSLTRSIDDTVDAAVERLRDELTTFLQSLVRIPSLPGREQAAQRFIASKYRDLALDTEIVPSERAALEGHPAFYDDGIPFIDRLNVIGRWKGSGGGRSLILNGHMDVVPPGDPAKWSRDPWNGDVRDGCVHGRGACDMKAGLSAALFAVQALKSLGLAPSGDVILESVIGEESGGIGALTTIVKGYRADACIIMEPTALNVCTVQSGALTFRLTVHGRAAHACLKSHGVSAVDEFAPIVEMLLRLGEERHRDFRHPLFEDPSNIAPISIGTVRSGEWHSMVPDLLVAEGRFGVFPGESIDEARAVLSAALDEIAASSPWLSEYPPELEWFEGQFESGETAPDAAIVETVRRRHEEVTGTRPAIRGVTYGADLRLFTRHAGIPTLLYGPGSIERAHAADELVPIEEVITCTKVLARTILQWCREPASPDESGW